jgi:hypothetical protein
MPEELKTQEEATEQLKLLEAVAKGVATWRKYGDWTAIARPMDAYEKRFGTVEPAEEGGGDARTDDAAG